MPLAAIFFFLATSLIAAETVVVTGVYEQIPLEEADRPVRSIDVRSLRLLSNTYADLLKLDASVDLKQRSPNGLQGDVSIRGGTFGQTLVLLDGLRLNDVQSAHHNLDVPVPLESLGSVEILKGSGSTLYGSDAVGGVVNFITRAPERSEMRLLTSAGNFGVNQQRATITVVRDRITQQNSFSRDFSSGFIPNRDFRNLSLASTTRIGTPVGETYLVLSYRDSPFGAEQFYGNFNSWERTKTWWVAGKQKLGQRTEVSTSWRKHTDLFVLYRDRPAVFTNRHSSETLQAAVRRSDPIGRNTTLFYGLEGFRDSIVSNNLGSHSRTRGSGYAAADVRAMRRFSFNAGVRDEIYGAGKHQISPTLSGGFWLRSTFKLRASVSRAFRLPTYTDLYYHDPANQGSPDLRPEKAISYEAGADWHPSPLFRVSVTVFERRETDGIDYVRSSPAAIWRATNFQDLQFTGVESDLRLRLPRNQHLEFSWTGLRGAQTVLGARQSKYVFNYPVNSGLIAWQGELGGGFLARTRIGIVERFNRDPYAVWDFYAAFSRTRFRPFLQFTNLTATRYEEIPGVRMQGRAIVGGVELVAFGGR